MTLSLPDSGAAIAPDGRRLTASAQRNAGPILQVLQDHAPRSGKMLELAAGSGLHAARFAAALPGLDWQPTDIKPDNFPSILAWAATCPVPIRPPVLLNAAMAGWSRDWPARDAILLVNLLHLIPRPAAETLLAELALALAPGGAAFVYGPFLRGGTFASVGDAEFDGALRRQDRAIGYKDADWVSAQMSAAGLSVLCLPMPANNLIFVARRP